MLKFFENYPEILAVMSERVDGSMKLFKGNDLNVENRKRFFGKVGIDEDNVVAAEIVHGTTVEIIDESSLKIIPGADGLVTKGRSIFISVTIADCIPVYFYEPEQKIIGIAHCGWRGIVAGITRNAVAKISELGGSPENLKVVIGPGINKCHFEIKEDVLDKFKNYPEFIIRKDQKIFVNLKGVIMQQLDELGIKPENIENDDECISENKDKYFSFRRDKPETPEAMVAVIGLRK